jgi:hypothetical protein
METPTLVGAFRNAAVMILLNPFFTLGVWLGVIVVVVLSTAFPAAWFLLTGAALAAIANSAVQDRLRAAGHEATPVQTEGVSDEAFYGEY